MNIEALKARGLKNDEVEVDEPSVFPSRSGTLVILLGMAVGTNE